MATQNNCSTNTGTRIQIADAQALIRAYRNGDPNQRKAVAYGSAHITMILAQPGCVGIRAYFAKDTGGELTLVICGVDANCNDITTVVVDMGTPCPLVCDQQNSPLLNV